LTATIEKKRAAALKLERKEQEIIVFDLPDGSWTEEPITERPPSRDKTLGDIFPELLSAAGPHGDI